MEGWWRNMKIYPRYLSPKSPFSERGLTIASLQFSDLICSIYRLYSITLWKGGGGVSPNYLTTSNLIQYPAFLDMQDISVTH